MLNNALDSIGTMLSPQSTAPDHGDFVDSDEEYDLEDSAGLLDRYYQGSYYPTCIGDVIGQTHRIEHNLSYRGFPYYLDGL
jgi:hypothetical protein